VQENRTPDNLFGSDAQPQPGGVRQLPGADLAITATCNGVGNILRSPNAFETCFDPDHGHNYRLTQPYHDAWFTTYHGGKMDGACDVTLWCSVKPLKQCPQPGCNPPTNVQLTYVDNSNGIVQPYFDIAMNYGYANYMFATNQGPSFEAHQFLFGGTSAPTPSNDGKDTCYDSNNKGYPCYNWFAAELQQAPGGTWGCPAGSGTDIVEIDSNGEEDLQEYNSGFPCYEHNTLADLLNGNWGYYPQPPVTWPTSLWTAPNAIRHICYNDSTGSGNCNSTVWQDNVVAKAPPNSWQQDAMAPIIEDIENCNLPALSWVIPDGAWSDHAGQGWLGPAWVAAIVNTVGGPRTNPCPNGENYWNDTVILVTWDDWGGWYDHIYPWNCKSNGTCTGYPNPDPSKSGSEYVYGFRVPLLVVSAYNKQNTQQGLPGYISGSCGNPTPPCPNNSPPYVHDFGSILAFTEYVFGLGEIDPYGYHYADYWAPDAYPSCPRTTCPFPLSDFFVSNLGNNPTPAPFVPVVLPPVFCPGGVCYDAEYFENYDGPPADPDWDALEQ